MRKHLNKKKGGSRLSFEKASLQQLLVIIRFEHCPKRYKNAALKNLLKR
ncbi:hypothetical protein CHCC15325_4380 [Bacillus licheniformis]|nr:hypothetical protein SC10_B2orf01480 [Bacillus paralicheniformis]OLF99001.1 hypothetical protein B4094_0334 [Bacillus licheniformis]OLG01274.1 hypothetical protein B4123_4438 [Bacillus paralicheniformis]OLG06290.1 hypothetical protein B4125_0471 [Bacillus paralicheniformis]TWJ42209.1 hypothetical protein CHCC5025_1761 [Bacillus licheniformis]